MAESNQLTSQSVADVIAPEDFQKLFSLLREVKFGTITLIIQDGKVVQIDRLEKIRLK
jgi:hypothetical protein